MVLWSLEDVTVPGRRVPRLDRVTAQLPVGVTAVLGQSGAGKTSLLNVLVQFEQPSSGRVTFCGSDNDSGPNVFWSPPNHGLWSHLTVREHLQTVCRAVGSFQSRGDTNHSQPDVDRLLLTFDLNDLSAVRPASLSLGERSRLSVARAIASGAKILIMDEPLTHVDPGRIGSYWAALREHCSTTETSLIFATHSPEVVLREAASVVCLAEGRLSYLGSVSKLYDHPTSPELAAMLGPCNWLTAEEASRWLATPGDFRAAANGSNRAAICIRPERLYIEAASEGCFVVAVERFAGSSAEVDVVDERDGILRTFIHRPAGPSLRNGDRIVIKYVSVSNKNLEELQKRVEMP